MFRLRLATDADVASLSALIVRSVRELQAGDYTHLQIAGALQTVFGVDSQIIADQTYFAVEAPGAELVACGGWSKRKTLFGGDRWKGREDALLDPRLDAAKIRAFFVHPAWTRRGIGSLILDACERAALAAGFTRFEMGATLTGVPLYLAKGYSIIERISVPLNNGEHLPIVRMGKAI
jgi:GNAT superfamily N-acetyltransferase